MYVIDHCEVRESNALVLVLHLDDFVVVVVRGEVTATGRARGFHGRLRDRRRHVVRFAVFGQVIRAHEPLAALAAGEAFLARVRSQMTLQFVRARERLAAEQPMATERTLAGVPAQVRLEMRGLAVDLLADVTDVLPFRVRRVVNDVRRLIETVGTTAAFASARDRSE